MKSIVSKLRFVSYDFFIFIILIIFTFILASSNQVSAEVEVRQGPPIVCDTHKETIKSMDTYKEEDFTILIQTTPDSLYFILYRNIETGSWSVLAYNIPHLSEGQVCLMLGGHSSFIIPDIEQMKDIINKQNKGLIKSTPKLSERES